MATIRTIEGKRGIVYRAIIRKRGQNLSRTFSTKSNARRWAAKTEAEIESGMDEAAYTIIRAWLLGRQSDEDQAYMIREQFISGRISLEQAVTAWLLLSHFT
ncbi:MAG: hypothetical protein GY727_16455 [Gammaproteobacteria bacterium]|nr:hypothetical protein [Gammaproteobacteria bacterium]MCP4088516.1 hypothetical protein [Gammaproteobacteria bacterium]MCP4276744.1 hypothetical protein [Gammaproteobacteria bacterium]MCP4830587.1 hypothetical protein [Gammaproteobacteria bacterium]MCP4928396.1 hypothetical protein [Gammaproteobacteria bacterium]